MSSDLYPFVEIWHGINHMRIDPDPNSSFRSKDLGLVGKPL